MDFPLDISFKVEKYDLERDDNDNIQQLLFDVEIKVEKELETNEDEDWCVSNFENCGDLLEPLFFKQVAIPEGPQCELCYRHFEDRSAILKHNLTHLRVTILNPTLFQCDHCAAYFTNKLSLKRHMITHNQNISRTKSLPYKPKAHKPNREMDSKYDKNFSKWSKLITYKPNLETDDCNQMYSKTRIKPRDGMTNFLKYKPKSCKAVTLQNCDIKLCETDKINFKTEPVTKKSHRCNKCNKIFNYKNWHAHMQDVHGEGGYFCGLCNIEFKCERYLKRHMNKIHIRSDNKKCPRGAKKMDVKCDQCDAVLQSLNALKTHKRNVHSGKRHVCHICESELKCKSYLLAHMRRVHYSDGKKHVCECGKNFRSHRYLMVHKRNAQHI